MQTFSQIEARRERLGVSQLDLCERADVHTSTYSRAKASASEPTERIRRKLARALEDIAQERGVALVDDGVAA